MSDGSGAGSSTYKADWTGGALNPADWRQAPAPQEPQVDPLPKRNAKPRQIDRLHVRARPATLIEERRRAAEVLAQAKGAVTSAFSDIRSGRRIDTAKLRPVVEAIAASVARNATALPSITRLKQKHEYTYLHSIAVCGLMIGLARELRLDPRLTYEIGLAGLLHDIGKAHMPAELLDKPGALDIEEYALMQQHTVRGCELLRDSGVDSELALDVCLHHHERMDGGGYPTGISAESISIHARMGAVCDVYDAVTSTRSYKEGWSPGAALDWMSGTEGQFDVRVLRSLRKMIGAFPIGALVRLSSGRLGVVLNEPAENPLTPDVCAFMDADTGRELTPTLTRTRYDPIMSLELSCQWGIDDWDGRRASLLQAFGSK